MTYTLMSVPEDKEVWCTGFRFDDTTKLWLSIFMFTKSQDLPLTVW